MKPRFGCLLQWKTNLWDRCWRKRKGIHSGVNKPEKMPGSCLQNHLSILGVIVSWYRGTLGKGELRNFWQHTVSSSALRWCQCYLLCASQYSFVAPSAVLLLINGTGNAGSISSCSDISCWHLPSSCGQGCSLVKQELQLLISIKYL